MLGRPLSDFGAFLFSKLNGREAILGLSRLDSPSAKTGGLSTATNEMCRSSCVGVTMMSDRGGRKKIANRKAPC